MSWTDEILKVLTKYIPLKSYSSNKILQNHNDELKNFLNYFINSYIYTQLCIAIVILYLLYNVFSLNVFLSDYKNYTKENFAINAIFSKISGTVLLTLIFIFLFTFLIQPKLTTETQSYNILLLCSYIILISNQLYRNYIDYLLSMKDKKLCEQNLSIKFIYIVFMSVFFFYLYDKLNISLLQRSSSDNSWMKKLLFISIVFMIIKLFSINESKNQQYLLQVHLICTFVYACIFVYLIMSNTFPLHKPIQKINFCNSNHYLRNWETYYFLILMPFYFLFYNLYDDIIFFQNISIYTNKYKNRCELSGICND